MRPRLKRKLVCQKSFQKVKDFKIKIEKQSIFEVKRLQLMSCPIFF